MLNVKKFACILLSLVFTLSCAACSGENNEENSDDVFDSAKTTYEKLMKAYELTDTISYDMYEAWRIGIYENPSVSKLDDGLKLTSDELNAGIDSLAGYEGLGDRLFSLMSSEKPFSVCLAIVKEAYVVKGTIDEIQTLLNDAKAEMKTMSEKNSDYEHYDNLKKLYSTVSSYYEFCNDPSGSFEQLKTTLNDYRNDVRDLESDLGYIFEE